MFKLPVSILTCTINCYQRKLNSKFYTENSGYFTNTPCRSFISLIDSSIKLNQLLRYVCVDLCVSKDLSTVLKGNIKVRSSTTIWPWALSLIATTEKPDKVQIYDIMRINQLLLRNTVYLILRLQVNVPWVLIKQVICDARKYALSNVAIIIQCWVSFHSLL